jgi:type IV pilus assembly protein PilA
MNAPPPPVAPPKKGMPTWLLVLICTVGAGAILVPILAVLAVYGVRKYIANAKTAEARVNVVAIAKDAVAAYDPGTHFCASARASVPSSASMIRGTKYQSAPADWGSSADGAIHAGFPCLGFSLAQPQYYQYAYTSPSPDHDRFEAAAHGDLDADGKVSSFVVRGTAAGGAPAADTMIDETTPEE